MSRLTIWQFFHNVGIIGLNVSVIRTNNKCDWFARNCHTVAHGNIFAKIKLSHPTTKRQEKTEPLVEKSRV